jgi:hypothetical protein
MTPPPSGAGRGPRPFWPGDEAGPSSAAGVGIDDRGYVLEDASGKFQHSPDRLDAMVFAFTELMVDGANDGIICFYEEELAAALEGRVSYATVDERDRILRLRAPSGLSFVSTLSGRGFPIPPDGVLELVESDARPLLASGGWRYADTSHEFA